MYTLPLKFQLTQCCRDIQWQQLELILCISSGGEHQKPLLVGEPYSLKTAEELSQGFAFLQMEELGGLQLFIFVFTLQWVNTSMDN